MTQTHAPTDPLNTLPKALRDAGFLGDIDQDSALRAAMSTDNSVYRITPDLVLAPRDAADVVRLMGVLEQPAFARVPVTARGGGTGTNGQSLNHGVILDMRRYMHRLIAIAPDASWAEVEPGMVLDDLNDQLRPHGVFFAPETSTSTRCTIGGMVSTDASGKGSRVYGKTSDNLVGVEIARGAGRLASWQESPAWAKPMLAEAELAARAGRAAFVAQTPRLNRRFTGYDLDRACADDTTFDWARLLPGSEGTLGPLTAIRVKLRPLPAAKRLIVAGFSSFRDALASATPLMRDEPTAIEVMDERVQALAASAGLLSGLPEPLRPSGDQPIAYSFIEVAGDADEVDTRVTACLARLDTLPGLITQYVAQGAEEIKTLWAIRSAGVGLLGKVEGRARPVAFVEDCVVPPEELPAFLDSFLDILTRHGLSFGIYGHVDVGCLHIRPALDIDSAEGRETLKQVSDEIFALVSRHGGIFWGEHGKGVRGAYLRDWIGAEAYAALQGVKAAFDPEERFNPAKLVSNRDAIMGIATTPFRPFNSPAGDALEKAFRCNGNAQCLSYAAATPMCPSFKATGDLRHSPKGRADALRAWAEGRRTGQPTVAEDDLRGILDTCLGCKACASTCPVQVDIPAMRAAFLADYHSRHARPLEDRLSLLAERLSPLALGLTPLMRPLWPMARRLAERLLALKDLPDLAAPLPRGQRLRVAELPTRSFPANTVIVVMDWFSALFDGETQRDVLRGLSALGFHPLMLAMRPSGKLARDLGDTTQADRMARALIEALDAVTAKGLPLVGLDPAFVMTLRQDYPKADHTAPEVLLPQEFLSRALRAGHQMPKGKGGPVTLMAHCTESTGAPKARSDWAEVFSALGLDVSTPATGCCGMAGMFGHKERHQKTSRRLFDLSWQKPTTEAPDLAVTGFSCRCQTERLSEVKSRHPLGLIADRLC